MTADYVPGRVSMIVPTRNSSRTIRACLESLRAQSGAEVELVVVDNASSDGTAAVARELADVFLDQGPERSVQRNVGACRSSGEFLVFVDSDMRVPKAAAREIVAAFAADEAVQALVLPEVSEGDGYWANCRALEKQLYLGDPDIEAARAFRRGAFFGAGGYDETLNAGGEDWDLPDRIAAAGARVGRIGSAVVHDEGRVRLRTAFAKKRYYGRSLTRYTRANPGRAARKLARPGTLARLPLLRRDPAHAPGLVVLKSVDLLGALTGMALGLVSRPGAPLEIEARRT